MKVGAQLILGVLVTCLITNVTGDVTEGNRSILEKIYQELEVDIKDWCSKDNCTTLAVADAADVADLEKNLTRACELILKLNRREFRKNNIRCNNESFWWGTNFCNDPKAAIINDCETVNASEIKDSTTASKLPTTTIEPVGEATSDAITISSITEQSVVESSTMVPDSGTTSLTPSSGTTTTEYSENGVDTTGNFDSDGENDLVWIFVVVALVVILLIAIPVIVFYFHRYVKRSGYNSSAKTNGDTNGKTGNESA